MRYLFISILLSLITACDSGQQNVALGTLERNRIAHSARVSEVIVALPVRPGSQVKQGTLLVKLDDTLQKAMLAKANAEVAQARANLDKLRNGARKEDVAEARARVAGARSALVESKANFQRSIDLVKRKLVSRADLDKTRAAHDSRRASLQTAQEQLLKLTNGTREEDMRIAEAKLKASIAIMASEQKKLSDLSIVAARDGILDNLPWNVGERVTLGSPVAIVLAGKAPFARVYVPEPYRVKLKVGDKLLVYIDGLVKPVSGRLRWIATVPAFTPYYALNQQERSRLMYLAEVQLPDNQAHLPNGVPAQVVLP